MQSGRKKVNEKEVAELDIKGKGIIDSDDDYSDEIDPPDVNQIKDFLRSVQQITHELHIRMLEAENQIQQTIQQKSTNYSNTIGLVGTVATLYLLNYTPCINQLNKMIEETIEAVVFSGAFQAWGFSQKAGFFSGLCGPKYTITNSAVEMITQALKYLNTTFISTGAVGQTALTGVALTFTRQTTKLVCNNFLKNRLTSSMQFFEDFDQLAYDDQKEFLQALIMEYLKNKLNSPESSFEDFIKNGKLTDLAKIRLLLINLENLLNLHLQMIHDNQRTLSKKEYDIFLMKYRCFPLIAPYPDDFQCPISLSVMEDPVQDSEGHTYDRKEITKWIKDKKTSPLTRREISVDELVSNVDLKARITEFKEERASLMQEAQEILEDTGADNEEKETETPRRRFK